MWVGTVGKVRYSTVRTKMNFDGRSTWSAMLSLSLQ